MILERILRRPVSVGIAALTLVVLGLVSLARLPVSLLPSLERPRLEVRLHDPDRGRDELLAQVVRPLERRLATLAGAVDVLAEVGDGEAAIAVETEWQTDVDRLRIDAERRLAEVVPDAPGAGGVLAVTVAAGDRRPILILAVTGGHAHARATFVDKVLLPELARLPGAGTVQRVGGALRRPVVRPRAADLAARGLTAADVLARLERVGREVPLGVVRDGAALRPLVLREPVFSVDELAGVVLETAAGTPLRLRDLADVGLEEVPEETAARWRGAATVLVELERAPGANAVLLARAARRAVAEAVARASGSLGVDVAEEASAEVLAALAQLGGAAAIGLLLGTGVLRLFLGSWRPTLALAVVVPASAVATFAAFFLGGVSLDLVSLAGLALAAGMLVDNSIVVLEAIATARDRDASADAAVAGTRQVALALVAGFLTTAVVFLPLIYLHGLARAFFGVQAFAVVSALLVSLGLSLTLTPVLARATGTSGAGRREGQSPGRELYRRLLGASLARPGALVAATAVVLAAAAATWPGLRRELVPEGEARGLEIELDLGSGLDSGAAFARLIAAEDAAVAAGKGALAPGLAVLRAGSRGELELVAAGLDAQRLRPAVAAALARLPGMTSRVEVRRGAVEGAVEQAGRRLLVEASAATPARTRDHLRRAADVLAGAGIGSRPVRRAAGDVAIPALPAPVWRLAWRPALTPGWGVREAVRAGLGRLDAGRVEIQGAEPAIYLAETRTPRLDLLPVPSPEGGGRTVPLAAVATVEGDLRPPLDERRSGRPAALLELPDGVDADRVERRLATLPLALDERVELAGPVRELRRAFGQLRLALGLGLVLVFLTVAALYESFAVPALVMTTVPVAVAGAVFALAATGGGLDVLSFLGLVLLAGIVVNNAIVLVHRIEQLRAAGVELDAAIREGALERYRPILMTTVTTLLGMVPLALLGGEGAELRRSLATAVSGGLVTSWLATLLVVPVLYRWARRP